MIELADFVSQSLVQIARAIEKANESLADSTAIVSPTAGVTNEGHLYLSDAYAPRVERTEFDVAVTATEGTHTKGGIGVAVGIVGLGSSGQSDTGRRSESRIKFSVPKLLPDGTKRPDKIGSV